MQRTFEETPNSRPESTTAVTSMSPASDSSTGSSQGFGRWWLAPIALLMGFAFLLWQVKTHGPVTRLDVRLRDGIQRDAHDPALSWMWRPARGMAALGDQSIALAGLFARTVLPMRFPRSLPPATGTAARR